MNRAERRRQERERGKKKTRLPAPLYLANKTAQQMAEATGAKIESINAWADIQREEIATELCKEFNDKLYTAENYITLANLLITIKSLNKTWGFTKSIQRFMENWNIAKEEVTRQGIEKTMIQVNREYGLDLEFDSFDIENFIKECEEKENERNQD